MSNIPSSSLPIQQESVQFDQPVSEASASAIGGAVNLLLSLLGPVGSYIWSDLDEPTFLNQLGNPSPQTWVLADGRNVVGSRYNQVTGKTNIPDMRATYMRAPDNGGSAAGSRGLDPHGNQPTGTFTSDIFAVHSHGITDPGHRHGIPLNNGSTSEWNIRVSNGGGTIVIDDGAGEDPDGSGHFVFLQTDLRITNVTVNNAGGAETAPKTTYANAFIRIN